MDKNDEKDENSCQEHNRCFIGCKTLQMSNLRCYLVQTGPSSLCSESTVSICPLLRHFEPSCFYCFFLDAGCRQFGCVAGQVDGRCAPGVTWLEKVRPASSLLFFSPTLFVHVQTLCSFSGFASSHCHLNGKIVWDSRCVLCMRKKHYGLNAEIKWFWVHGFRYVLFGELQMLAKAADVYLQHN